MARGTNGSWVGYGVGDSGPDVELINRKLVEKFSWARTAGVTYGDTFTTLTGWAVGEFCRRVGFPVTFDAGGNPVANLAVRARLGAYPPPPPAKKGVLLTVQGTGVDMFTGYPADTARALSDVFDWQPIGNYPALAFPMKDSYDQGIEELVRQCRRHAGRPKVLAGYSQGGIVVSRVWKHEIVDPRGRLHDLKHEFVGAVTWGNPDRELGVANGNVFAGWPVPLGRGVTDDRMVDTPSWWLDFAHGGNSLWGRDIYTDTPDDDAGEDMTAIWRIVEKKSVAGRDGLLEQVFELLKRPLVEAVAMFNAVYYAGAFFLARPYATMPHINYDIAPAVDYLRRLGNAL